MEKGKEKKNKKVVREKKKKERKTCRGRTHISGTTIHPHHKAKSPRKDKVPQLRNENSFSSVDILP